MFSDWIKSLEKQGVKLYEIADVIDVTYQTIQCYRDRENYPTAKNLMKLSEYYGVTVDEMLYYPNGGLTSEEKELLRLYWELPPEDREKLAEYLKNRSMVKQK